MSYTLTDYSATEVELNDGIRSYYYKKCYCSVELQGEYIVFTSHKVENNAFRQQWSIAYTDFTTPTGTASAVYNAIKTIIENYAGSTTGGGIKQGTASGTDTYTTSITGVTSYTDGDAYLIRFTNGNTTGCNLNINSLGAVPLYRNNDGQLIGGDIQDGAEMLVVYNSSVPCFQCIGTSPNSIIAYVTNDDSVTLTKGMPVYAFSGTGDRMTVKRANNTSDATSAQTVGLVMSTSIAANQKGFIMMQGLLDGLSILKPANGWSDGDAVYLGSTAGTLTKAKPYAPNHLVYLGFVTTASPGSAGRMYVRVQNGYELDELHNVQAQSPSNKDTIYFDNASSQWKTASLATILGYTPVASNAAITGATKTKITYDTKGLVTSGADATTADIADSTNKRYVTDAQLVVIGNTSGTNTGDQTLVGLGGVPTSRTISTTSPLSGGGDLSANRTLSIADASADGTTKGVATFNANDFNSASGVISLDYTNGQAASGSNKGFLTSADWSTFNSKGNGTVTAVTGTSPIVSSGGTTPAISLPVATSGTDGYLSSTDWNSFNNNMLGFGQYRKAGRWYTNALFGPANGTVSITANQISYLPFWVDASFTLTGLGVNITTAGAAASTARLGIYTNAGATTAPSTRLVDSGTFLVDTTGPKTVTGLSVALTKGLYWLAFFSNSASGAITGFGNDRIIDVRGLATIGGIGFARNTQALAYAALPATAGSLADVNATTTHCIYYTF